MFFVLKLTCICLMAKAIKQINSRYSVFFFFTLDFDRELESYCFPIIIFAFFFKIIFWNSYTLRLKAFNLELNNVFNWTFGTSGVLGGFRNLKQPPSIRGHLDFEYKTYFVLIFRILNIHMYLVTHKNSNTNISYYKFSFFNNCKNESMQVRIFCYEVRVSFRTSYIIRYTGQIAFFCYFRTNIYIEEF